MKILQNKYVNQMKNEKIIDVSFYFVNIFTKKQFFLVIVVGGGVVSRY